MKVITGTAKGKPLSTVQGTEIVRPTSQRIKEALFSAIQFDIIGTETLDLFCGSGQIGIEALSRGATNCTFVDQSKKSIEVTKKNIASTNLEQKSKVVNSEYNAFLQYNSQQYDIIFLDPPYDKGIIQEVLPKLMKCTKQTSIIICEHNTDDKMEEKVEEFEIAKQYKYSKTTITIYKRGAI